MDRAGFMSIRPAAFTTYTHEIQRPPQRIFNAAFLNRVGDTPDQRLKAWTKFDGSL